MANLSPDWEAMKIIDRAIKVGFPKCKGVYPDCPDLPKKDDPMCRGCPVLEGYSRLTSKRT